MIASARLRLTLVLVMASLMPITATSLTAQEVLTNESVVALKKAGLSDTLILTKIRTSPAKFDVSTKGLIALKSAGLSDQIIEAMVGHPGTPASAAAAPAAPATVAAPAVTAVLPAAPAAGTGPRDTIFHLIGGKYVEMRSAASSIETNVAFFSTSSELVLKGRKAQYRVSDKQPVFYSTWPPNEAPLVRLKRGDDHDDRNLKISSGAFHPFGGTQRMGVRSEDSIEVESEKDTRGLFKLTPKQPLPAGEYGFVLTFGLAAGASGKVFDFGVD
jgi:hypothetical protein